MTTFRDSLIALILVCLAFTYAWYFRHDLRRWWIERQPRRQLEREAAAEREAELARLRDELADKYLPEPTKPSQSGR
jgi:hypothetical protein